MAVGLIVIQPAVNHLPYHTGCSTEANVAHPTRTAWFAPVASPIVQDVDQITRARIQSNATSSTVLKHGNPQALRLTDRPSTRQTEAAI